MRRCASASEEIVDATAPASSRSSRPPCGRLQAPRASSSLIPRSIIATWRPAAVRRLPLSFINAINGLTTIVRASEASPAAGSRGLCCGRGRHHQRIAPFQRGLHSLALPRPATARTRALPAAHLPLPFRSDIRSQLKTMTGRVGVVGVPAARRPRAARCHVGRAAATGPPACDVRRVLRLGPSVAQDAAAARTQAVGPEGPWERVLGWRRRQVGKRLAAESSAAAGGRASVTRAILRRAGLTSQERSIRPARRPSNQPPRGPVPIEVGEQARARRRRARGREMRGTGSRSDPHPAAIEAEPDRDRGDQADHRTAPARAASSARPGSGEQEDGGLPEPCAAPRGRRSGDPGAIVAGREALAASPSSAG